jgi:hypothetical protein
MLCIFLMSSINLAYSQTYNCYDFDEISNDDSIVFRKGDTILVYQLPSSQYIRLPGSQYVREHITKTKTDSLIEFIKERLSELNFYL